MIVLGLDVGSNSVGSAWVDMDNRLLDLGVGIFPAGVEEQANKRGTPVNQGRREKRSQRLSIRRRGERSRLLRKVLVVGGLLPQAPADFDHLTAEADPFDLRRRALKEPLTPFEFGRVLVHLNRRRGATGIVLESDEEAEEDESEEESGKDRDEEEGLIKAAIGRLRKAMEEAHAETVGQFLADLRDQRRKPLPGKPETLIGDPIRNRLYRMDPEQFLYADRQMVREEFLLLWDRQRAQCGELAKLLTDDLKKKLDDPTPDATWSHHGALFGQRRTYWNTGTLGRCDLEPTDRCCPLADMHAQEYRVVESVNNIRMQKRGGPWLPLSPEQREKVIAALRTHKTATVSTIRKALGIDKKEAKAFYSLNIESDEDRPPNTDWFYRQIVHGVFGEEAWRNMPPPKRESVNRAILKFDPDIPEHVGKIAEGASKWWGLGPEAAQRFVEAWKKRPNLEKRLNLSRRAVRNLLPYMNQMQPDGRWLTQIEARRQFAEDGNAIDQTTGAEPTMAQRQRYGLGAAPLTRAGRLFMEKHPDLLPPAPMLANPVVRKAVHEVRRHVIEYIRKYGRRPDRVVIELAGEAKHSAIVRDRMLARNRRRDRIRTAVRDEFRLGNLSETQQRKAIDRVLLCRQQRNLCPYCDQCVSETGAAKGAELEADHIVPFSRSGDNALSNRVVCHAHCNRGKGSQTPREWLGPERFGALENRFLHFRKPERKDTDYFSPRDFKRKWDNFHREICPQDEFRNSQLSDTSYAAKEVADYLGNALYPGEEINTRVFFTKGVYTDILRRDWQLFRDTRLGKVRDDHRHHAIDAAVIALTDPGRTLKDLARHAAEREEAKSRRQVAPDRKPLPPPWGSVEEFRGQVMDRVKRMIVCHRAVKRRLAGAFHKEEHYGPVLQPDGTASRKFFTKRIQGVELTPKHLRLPEGGEELENSLTPETPRTQWRAAWRKLLALHQANPAKPEKSGIVRELTLRLEIRRCLRRNGMDPDKFSDKDVKKLAAAGELRMSTGMPVKSVVLLRVINDPVLIPRKVFDPATGKMLRDSDPRTKERSLRVYESQNNHHVEIRRDQKGRWTGQVVTAFTAACRVRRGCAAWTCENCLGASGYVPAAEPKNVRPVDRFDHEGDGFVMSLSEGETLHMRHPETGEPDYFVVFKLDRPATVHFTYHWDARPSGKTDKQGPREDIAVPVSKLKDLGPEPGKEVRKVRISPLGKITQLEND